MRRTEVGRVIVAAGCRVDIGAVVRLCRVLCGPVARIRLRQAVCRVGAVVWLAVERVWVLGAGCVLVEERAADLIFVLPAVVLGALSVCCHHVSGSPETLTPMFGSPYGWPLLGGLYAMFAAIRG